MSHNFTIKNLEIPQFTPEETTAENFPVVCSGLWRQIYDLCPNCGVIVNLVLAEVPENFIRTFVRRRPICCRGLAVGLNGVCIAGGCQGHVRRKDNLSRLRPIPTGGPDGLPLPGF
ncbi:hypothetical protein JNK13_05920 [bacterium]|nr:hypothetical protein [bacterium]